MLATILAATSKIDSFLNPKSPTVIGAPQTPKGGFISEAGALSGGIKDAGSAIKNAISNIDGEQAGAVVGSALGIGGTLGAAIGGALAGKKKDKASTVSLKVDIVKTVEYNFEQEVASHPVETGFEIQDNVVNKPLKVTMTLGVSSAPVTWFTANGKGNHKFSNAYDALMAIRDAKQPVTITRPNRILSDMLMTSCKLSKTQESLSVMMVEVTFVQIVKVDTETVEIPKDIVAKAAKEKAGLTAKAGGAAGKGKGVGDIAAQIKAGAKDIADSVLPSGDNESWAYSIKHAGDKKGGK